MIVYFPVIEVEFEEETFSGMEPYEDTDWLARMLTEGVPWQCTIFVYNLDKNIMNHFRLQLG